MLVGQGSFFLIVGHQEHPEHGNKPLGVSVVRSPRGKAREAAKYPVTGVYEYLLDINPISYSCFINPAHAS